MGIIMLVIRRFFDSMCRLDIETMEICYSNAT